MIMRNIGKLAEELNDCGRWFRGQFRKMHE